MGNAKWTGTPLRAVLDRAGIKPGLQTLRGIAFDGGTGIKAVELSIDDDTTWHPAALGADAGKYAFRGWTAPVTLAAGDARLKVRAISNAGETQPVDQPWNAAGYLRNLVETTTVRVARNSLWLFC